MTLCPKCRQNNVAAIIEHADRCTSCMFRSVLAGYINRNTGSFVHFLGAEKTVLSKGHYTLKD